MVWRVKRKAKEMQVNSYRMKKKDLIRAIQRAESNIDCYATPRVEVCSEDSCLWSNDCRSNGDTVMQQ